MIDLSDLTAIVGDAHVLTGADVRMRNTRWGQDAPCLTRAIVRPADTGELARVMAACAAVGQVVVVHGGLTGLTGGTEGDERGIAISLERMTAIERCDSVERAAYVQAGVTVQALQQAADRVEMSFPVDFGARGSATIGGAISTNAGGNRVFRFGSMREQVLGVEAVLADGTIVDAMRGLVKDNTGYDIKQLFIGSEGTLGIVTRACIRLRPKLRSCATALLAVERFEHVLALLNHFDGELGGQLSAFEVMWRDFYDVVAGRASVRPLPPGQPYYVLAEAEGSDQPRDQAAFEACLEAGVEQGLIADAVIAQSEADRLRLWALRDDIAGIFGQGDHLDFDVSLRAGDMIAYVDGVAAAVRAIAPDIGCFVFGHIADGNLHLVITRADGMSAEQAHAVKQAVYGPLEGLAGSVSAEHGIGFEKRDYLPLSRRPEEIMCMRMLKRTFDPANILNPGRILNDL